MGTATLEERKRRALEYWQEFKDGCVWAVFDGESMYGYSIADTEDEAWRRWENEWEPLIPKDDMPRMRAGLTAKRIIITKVDE